MEAIVSIIPPVHREGHKFIAIFAIAALFLFLIAEPLGWFGVVMTCWCVYFFRDPDRVTPQRKGLIISPADGVVSAITSAPPPRELEMTEPLMTRVSIFMNVFDCHVNRAPVDGVIEKIAYTPGLFLNASLDKSSEDNERNAMSMTLENGKHIAVVQIAGLIARRIVSSVQEQQHLHAGERFGMIRFGSRVDVYLPAGVAPLVGIGQTMIAGETVIADMLSDETPRLSRKN